MGGMSGAVVPACESQDEMDVCVASWSAVPFMQGALRSMFDYASWQRLGRSTQAIHRPVSAVDAHAASSQKSDKTYNSKPVMQVLSLMSKAKHFLLLLLAYQNMA